MIFINLIVPSQILQDVIGLPALVIVKLRFTKGSKRRRWDAGTATIHIQVHYSWLMLAIRRAVTLPNPSLQPSARQDCFAVAIARPAAVNVISGGRRQRSI